MELLLRLTAYCPNSALATMLHFAAEKLTRVCLSEDISLDQN
jgi:hypothetical protein